MSGTVLVTGGAGFIGSHTVDALLERGYRVRVLDNLQPRVHPTQEPPSYLSGVEFIRGDVTRREDMQRALEGVRYVFQLAAYQDYLPDFSTFFHTNTVGTALLYELLVAKPHQVEKVVVASSQAVYGEGLYVCREHGDVIPHQRERARLDRGEWDPTCPECGAATSRWKESDESRAHPENAYALSKYAQELAALSFGKRYQIPTVALRYSIVQGPRQSFHNAYSGACRVFCVSHFFGQQPPLFEDGKQVRDFVNIKDAVAANLLVLERDEANYQAFNVGGGKAYSIAEFAAIVAREYGHDLVPTVTGKYRFADTRNIVSDIRKLRALGWEPKYTPADSVRDYVAWLRSHPKVENTVAHAQSHMDQLGVVRSSTG